MSPLYKAITPIFIGAVLLGTAVGYSLGYGLGEKAGLAADQETRETLISEIDTLNTQNQQQQLSIKTSEATMVELARNMDDQQRRHDSEMRELELYRRIESGGLSRGVHVDDVHLLESGEGAALRITLLQVGGRTSVQGELSLALIGENLPASIDNRLTVANEADGTGLAFDFRFMTQVVVPLPPELAVPTSAESTEAWLEGLDLLEIDLISADSRRKPTRITVPADRMIVGPGE